MKRWGMQNNNRITDGAVRRVRTFSPLVAIMPALLGLWASAARAGFINDAAQEALVAAPALSVAVTSPTAAPGAVSVGPSASAPSVAASVLPGAATQNSAVIGEGRRVTQIGFHPAEVTIPKGRGRNIALSDMIPVIVPHDFQVDMGNVEPTLLVTWSGGLPWDTVLTNAIAPLPEVHVTFDWDKRSVILRRGAVNMPATPATAIAAASALAPTPALPAGPVPAKGAPMASLATTSITADVAPDHVVSFTLLGGQSLEAQLTDWAKRAGWSVTWNTPDDWIVPHDSSYGGDFEQAVKSVFTQVAEDGADVRADIWQGNKAVVVDKSGVTR